jgi:hypothetical protein
LRSAAVELLMGSSDGPAGFAALSDNTPAFVRLVYQQARDYNQRVFSSAVFGVPACRFS